MHGLYWCHGLYHIFHEADYHTVTIWCKFVLPTVNDKHFVMQNFSKVHQDTVHHENFSSVPKSITIMVVVCGQKAPG